MLLYWVLELHSRLQLTLAAGTSSEHGMRVGITNVCSWSAIVLPYHS